MISPDTKTLTWTVIAIIGLALASLYASIGRQRDADFPDNP